jgi:hypothetical protein
LSEDRDPTIREPGDHISIARHNAINGLMAGFLSSMVLSVLTDASKKEILHGNKRKTPRELGV